MFKKICKISIISIILSINLFAYTALADNVSPMFQKIQIGETTLSKVTLVNNLPDKQIPEIIAKVIKIILTLASSLALVSFTVGGVMMLTANGAEDKVSKAKWIILWSVIALGIMAAAFAIVTGVTKLSKNFFTAPATENQQQNAPGTGDLNQKEKDAMSKNNL